MKNILMFMALLYFCGCDKKINPQNKFKVQKIENISISDTNFQSHFHILDSANKISISDSIYCCPQSIKFMEIHTNIDASSDGTLLGKLFFTKEDLKNWHNWYEKNGKK